MKKQIDVLENASSSGSEEFFSAQENLDENDEESSETENLDLEEFKQAMKQTKEEAKHEQDLPEIRPGKKLLSTRKAAIKEIEEEP